MEELIILNNISLEMFRDENELREQIIKWLKSWGLRVAEKVYLGNIELDIVAVARVKMIKNRFISSSGLNLFVIEAKIATSRKLMFELIEQAITRLLVADYVLIAMPSKIEIWINEKEKKLIEPPLKIKKLALGPYSRKIGIIGVDPKGEVKIERSPQKSGLTQEILKREVLKRIS